MRITVLLIYIVCNLSLAQAQDKNDVAIALYQKAENAYSIADYEATLNSIKQAEQALGSTNTKLLYLKIKSLEMLSKVDVKYLPDLKQSLSAFFNMVDKNTYPQSKYNEMILASLTSESLSNKEEQYFNKVENSDNIEDYEDFFELFPNSNFKTQLNDKYEKLKEEKRLLQLSQKESRLANFSKEWKKCYARQPFLISTCHRMLETEILNAGMTVEEVKAYKKK